MSYLVSLFLALSVLVFLTPIAAQVRRNHLENQSNNLLSNLGVKYQTFHQGTVFNHNVPLYTNLDRELRQVYLEARQSSLESALRNFKSLLEFNRKEGKAQPVYPSHLPFPCQLNNTRSPTRPTTVDKLRPGDIDVISAIGDSLSAGNGLLSMQPLDLMNEYRGLAFSGGGFGDWRSFLTLPNIMKVFNPQLYGYATDNSLVANQRKSRLNVAEPSSVSRDLFFQVRVLIDRMRRDPHVDMQNHWKLLTLFLGSNDLCADICHWKNPQALLDQHEGDLKKALRMLRDNVPRLLINLIVAPNVEAFLRDMTPLNNTCFMVHRISCSCVISDRLTKEQRRHHQELIMKWQQVDVAVAQLPEFRREDFAIIVHPVVTRLSSPKNPDGSIDWRIVSHDCFHFSQMADAMFANALWNSMMLPDAEKPRSTQFLEPFERFDCPTEEQPYIVVK